MGKQNPKMREHVEIAYPAELPDQPLKVDGMDTSGCTSKCLSLDKGTGEGTEEVDFAEGWTGPGGHFNHDIEIFVLDGDLDIGGFHLHKYSYTFIPAGMPVGPWKSVTKAKALWMPFGYLSYETEEYKELPAEPESQPCMRMQRAILVLVNTSHVLIHRRCHGNRPSSSPLAQPARVSVGQWMVLLLGSSVWFRSGLKGTSSRRTRLPRRLIALKARLGVTGPSLMILSSDDMRCSRRLDTTGDLLTSLMVPSTRMQAACCSSARSVS